MRYVKFLRDTDEKREGRAFFAGAVVALKPASAARWVRRNAAEYVNVFEPVKAEPQPEPTNGDVLGSAPDVEGADGGDTGERPEPDARASAPRRRGRPPRNSGQ